MPDRMKTRVALAKVEGHLHDLHDRSTPPTVEELLDLYEERKRLKTKLGGTL